MNEQNHTAAAELRARLAAADPAQRVSIDPIPPRLMEHVMNTNPVTTPPSTTPDHPAPDLPTPDLSIPRRPRRRWRLPAAFGGAAVAAAAAVIGVASLSGGNAAVTAEPLELTGGNDALASCMAFSVDILAQMPTAFEGTVTSVDGATVTLDVERWYAHGTDSSSDTVIVNAPEGMEALIGGIAFEPGGHYLISADAEGNVSYCGYTAPATEELRAAFGDAFPG